jgi:hypothetical protein
MLGNARHLEVEIDDVEARPAVALASPCRTVEKETADSARASAAWRLPDEDERPPAEPGPCAKR